MSAEASKETTEPYDLNVGLIATITIVGALLVIAIAAALTALVRSESTTFGLESGAYADLGTVKRLKAEQKAKLEAPIAWTDKAKGKVALPIERAMELVQNDIQRDPFAATVAPPATAAPEGTPGTPGTPGVTGAASAAPSGAPAPATGGAAAEPSSKSDKKAPEPKPPLPPGGKVDPPSGAPVTPAAAPAPKK
jgi:hypothetical protein